MVDIRFAAHQDRAALAEIMIEMQRHYGAPHPAVAAIIDDLEHLPPGTHVLIACDDARILGFAAFSAIYPGPGLSKGMFLKELYVTARARGAGVGRALLVHLAGHAKANGFGRIDWTADADDERLLSFYRNLGGAPQPKKLFFRLSGQALAGLADRAPSA